MNQKGFIALPLTTWALLGMGVVILGLGLALKFQTLRLESCKAEYQSFVSQTKSLGDQAKAEAKKEVERQKQVNEESVNSYEKRLAYLNDAYKRLRDQRSRQSGVSTIPEAPRTVDAIPTDALPLAAECAATTEQLVQLQEWARKALK